jgi:hypothetical protein
VAALAAPTGGGTSRVPGSAGRKTADWAAKSPAKSRKILQISKFSCQ